MRERYTSGQAAKLLGVHKKTLFYWERTGKIKPRRDNLMNYRYFTPEDLKRMKNLKTKRGRKNDGHCLL
jgi:DNA-binding transcriptional MerR regulator